MSHNDEDDEINLKLIELLWPVPMGTNVVKILLRNFYKITLDKLVPWSAACDSLLGHSNRIVQ